MDAPVDRLETAARDAGFPGVPDSLAMLRGYLEAVVAASKDVNLTAAATFEEAVEVLALSAFAVTDAWPRDRNAPRLVIDLGSGNGFPGVVAALAWPDARVLLVERRAKKANAIAACLARAGIGNAEAVACDGRELARERPEVVGRVELVTVRAVGTLEEALRIAAPWLAPGGRVAHWKGANLPEAESAAGGAAALREGLVALPEKRYPVPPGPARLLLHERPRPRGAGRGRKP